MSNLRNDSRELVKDLPPGDTYKAHIECLCSQIDLIEGWWHESNRRLKAIQDLLERAVCTEGIDKGVILLSLEGTTHVEVIANKPIAVYDNDFFSPLGDVLIAAWEQASGKKE